MYFRQKTEEEVLSYTTACVFKRVCVCVHLKEKRHFTTQNKQKLHKINEELHFEIGQSRGDAH